MTDFNQAIELMLRMDEVGRRNESTQPQPSSSINISSGSLNISEDGSVDESRLLLEGNDCVVRAISERGENRVLDLFKRTDYERVVCMKFNIPIKVRDIQTLQPGQWLNDEIINFYLEMIVERGRSNGEFPPVYAFSSFFYPKLTASGYESVKKWTRRVDIFSFEILLIPIHKCSHWTLAVVDLKAKQINYYDSLAGSNPPDQSELLSGIFNYLENEHESRKNQKLNKFQWKWSVGYCPRQLNFDDCGVFLCQVAETLSRRSPIVFDGNHRVRFCVPSFYQAKSNRTETLRKLMVLQIINGTIEPSDDNEYNDKFISNVLVSTMYILW